MTDDGLVVRSAGDDVIARRRGSSTVQIRSSVSCLAVLDGADPC